jgi:hypothetical protein
MKSPLALSAALLVLGLATAASAASAVEPRDDAIPSHPFEEGQTLQFEDLPKIQSYIPEPFWENREYFFHEGMKLEIGPFYADFGPTEERKALTAQYGGQARIGRDGSLENYTLGQPFPEIDPEDPLAGVKHAWNMDYKHDALEGKATFYFTYWDNGERLPLHYKGEAWLMRLSRRTDRADNDGNIFETEKRKGAGGIYITEPFDVRGINGIGYRYLSADGPRDTAKIDDAWAYIPNLRRVRRFSGANRNDAVGGTDFTPDDGGSFAGVTPQFEWEYIGETDVLAPIDTRLRGFPFEKNANFGPSGFSLADDIWHLRRVMILEFRPKDEDHIYARKRFWVDKQTYSILYSAAYDRKGELWKLIYHAFRWSESEDQPGKIRGIRAFLRVVDMLVNVRTGTGNRIEFWDAQPTKMSKREIRKKTDIGRLSREGR